MRDSESVSVSVQREKALVYGGWESSLDHTEGDNGIPVPLAPDLGLNQGRVREVAAADCLDEDTAVPFPGRAHSGPSADLSRKISAAIYAPIAATLQHIHKILND
ncbi:hypothetical protein B5X24_HaOG212078 [Helicoverpa armigera]|uniref:Uncharacterized protein n=1 Tax=Helicoverpa armigera TaxID=29058 RepID=A0A2W1BA36_HELAM|nr:hypothetical protein B5X24_HaOG212078 [Helicoverpa armigera]